MKNSTKIILILFIVATSVGTIIKLNGYKSFGDALLLISVVAFLYLLYTFIFKYLNRKRTV